MNRSLIFLAWAFAVTACTPDVRTLELDSLDLRDTATISHIRSQLDATEGRAFANYLVRHITISEGYCGRPLLGQDGEPPVTLGDAIAFSMARDREEKLATRSATVTELQTPDGSQLVALRSERDDLMSARMFLRGQDRQSGQVRRDLDTIDQRIALVDRRIANLVP